MTGNDRRAAAPMGPPWSLDLLADLHAGVLDDAAAAELWPQVNADPQARSVLEALDVTRTELASLPVMRMPEDVALRIDRALAEESRARSAANAPAVAHQFPQTVPPQAPQTGQVIDLADARRRRNRIVGWSSGIVVAAAAVLGIAVVLPNLNTTGGSPGGIAAPPTSVGGSPTSGAPGQLALTDGSLPSALHKTIGSQDYGPLNDPATLSGCLKANHADPNTKPSGARQVTLNGKPGTLLVLTTGKIGQFRLLVVGPTCSANDPAKLGDAMVGGH